MFSGQGFLFAAPLPGPAPAEIPKKRSGKARKVPVRKSLKPLEDIDPDRIEGQKEKFHDRYSQPEENPKTFFNRLRHFGSGRVGFDRFASTR
ncbi:MAG: hypothetical protein NT009_12725 [Proteobacteria bacterium]|nr:hypothetical protein [Pseudomonadota bacterium]